MTSNLLRVCSFESRRGPEMARLIEKFGGLGTIVPSMKEVPVEDHREAFEFGLDQLAALPFLVAVMRHGTLLDPIDFDGLALERDDFAGFRLPGPCSRPVDLKALRNVQINEQPSARCQMLAEILQGFDCLFASRQQLERSRRQNDDVVFDIDAEGFHIRFE